jgi:hypothetical protein
MADGGNAIVSSKLHGVTSHTSIIFIVGKNVNKSKFYSGRN